jgi:hypothetical protein
MGKGYYKDPKTGEITKGGFEDAWSKFMTSKVYDADEAQLDDEDEIFISYDDDGAPLEEEIRKEFSLEETKAIAKEVSKGVAMALKAVGDEVTSMKVINIEPNSFEIYVVYKNGADDYFNFYIDEDDTLYLVDFPFDKELVDVGVKSSGEAVVNISALASKLSNHWKSFPSGSEEIETDYMKYRKSFDDYLNEDMTDEEFEDAKEANRLANHPKREIIKKIQAMIAKEKKASYATEDTDINNDGKVDKTDDELEYLNKINRSHFQTESLDLNEGGGTLKVEKQKDGKYYWTFTFKSGKVEEWPNGFATSAEAQKDFMYRSKYLKEEAEEYVKRVKSRGATPGRITAYWVSDKDMNRVDEETGD